MLRLSKKVMELEEQVKAAEEINSAFKAGRRPKNAGLGVPVAPAKFVLKGHRAQVNAVAFHPVFTNVVVTASEDASVRVWDAETGECVGCVRPGAAAAAVLTPWSAFLVLLLLRNPCRAIQGAWVSPLVPGLCLFSG